MLPAGYLYKSVEKCPGWLGAAGVVDIYSLSGCISKNFTDYTHHWKHNGYWLFDTPQPMVDIAREEGVDLALRTLFYFEVYAEEVDGETLAWAPFGPTEGLAVDVRPPTEKRLQGFDIATFSGASGAECSPLSCNGAATSCSVNAHCLFDTFEQAKQALDGGLFQHSEPGPFRIFAVYTVPPETTKLAGRRRPGLDRPSVIFASGGVLWPDVPGLTRGRIDEGAKTHATSRIERQTVVDGRNGVLIKNFVSPGYLS